MRPSNMFGEVNREEEGVVMTSINFNYICLSRFINYINHKLVKGFISDCSIVSDVDSDDESVSTTFILNSVNEKISIDFSFSAFREYLLSHGYRKPSVSDIELEIKVYINRLIDNKAVYR